MKFSIFVVKNGYLLNIYYSKTKTESIIYKDTERMTMLSHISTLMGPEPDGSVGMELETKN